MGTARITAPVRERRGGYMAMGLPVGRRSPKGRQRWYLLRVPEGRESAVCERLLNLVSSDVLDDAFFLQRERWMKRNGTWSLHLVPVYKGYAFAVSRDAAGLSKAISKLTLPVELVGTEDRAWAPLSDEMAAWFAHAMDGRHVIRSSTALIQDGSLHVIEGPLMGQEGNIAKVDRHRRFCLVDVLDSDGGFTVSMPIDVPNRI